LEWKFKTGDRVWSSPAVSGDYVYVGFGYFSAQRQLYSKGSIHCIDKNTGESKWELETRFDVQSSPAVSGNYVYIGVHMSYYLAHEAWKTDDYIQCLDKDTGELKWKFKTGGNVRSSPAVSGDYVYVGSGDNYVYCLNKNTGELEWKFKTDGAVDSSPAVSENYVYVGSDDGYVYAFTTLKSVGSPCSDDPECKTKNCFKGVCSDEGYCDADSDCSSGQYCSGNKCETLKSVGSPCSDDPECETKNCFKGVCSDEGYCDADSDCSSGQYCSGNKCEIKKGIEIPRFFIPGLVISLIFLILVYFVIKRRK